MPVRPVRKAFRRIVNPLLEFLKLEAFGGVLLMIAAVVAVMIANSEWGHSYEAFWLKTVGFDLPFLQYAKSVHFWINEGLMTVFFLLIGLEIKHEMLHGVLASRQRAMMPLICALGGIVMPALLYLLINTPGMPTSKGWGIPVATDIAFTMAVLMLLGNRIPLGLKVFLMALAVADDLGCIVVMTLFYTGTLSWLNIALAVLFGLMLLTMSRKKIRSTPAYLFAGFLLWAALLESGFPATVAGVLLASAIPADVTEPDSDDFSPVQKLQHTLHPWVNFGVMPLFTLANAGVSLQGGSILASFQSPVTLGIMAGSVLGKPLGIGLSAWLSEKLNWAVLPDGITFRQLVYSAFLCGICFTMALFVAYLAFEGTDHLLHAKIGIFTASIIASVIGCVLLLREFSAAEQSADLESD